MKTILVDARNTFLTEDGINKDIQSLLDAFPNQKIIVTNANDEQRITFGIIDMPYEVFTLKHNPDKTDPKYFETLLTTYWLDIADLVYFEHNSDAVNSAQSMWITTYHYDKDTKDIEKLKEFIIKNV